VFKDRAKVGDFLMRPRARSTRWARAATARTLLVLVGLPALIVACGGRSHDPHSPGVTGAGGESNAAAGASSGAGSSRGGESNTAGGAGSGGTGGASAAAGTTSVRAGQTMCWLWSALKNQPNSGASGIDACPSFYDLEFVVRENCVYKVIDPSPVPPDAMATGDCCYSITEYSCR